jgi:hypothetical protein
VICDVMLDRMLEAGATELDGVGDTVIARHVRECARCRRVARALRDETARLSNAVAAASQRRALNVGELRVRERHPRYVTPTSVGAVLIAAALLLMLLPRGKPAGVDSGAPPVVANEVPKLTGVRPVPASPSAPVADPVPSIPAGARQFAPSAFARAQTVAAVPVEFNESDASVFDVAPTDVDMLESDVVVTPPSGVRAAVMRGVVPGVTVIWLH